MQLENALLRLGFPAASQIHLLNLAAQRNSLARSTKSTQSPFLIGLLLFVSTRFQVLFHSPPGVLFTFPSRYWFAIGHQDIFRLGRWSSRLPTGLLVSRSTLVLTMPSLPSPTRLLRSAAPLSSGLRLALPDHLV